LGVPEIVPFRLTPNLIDAMGVLGYEGSFRKSSELTMSLIRGNEIILMNFLESFIHDPLMDWRGSTSSTSAVRAEERIQKIKRTQERVYKIIRRKIRGVLTKDDDNTNYRDSGGLSVSVSLQVELLIQTASSHENLSKMFFGWMPFL
jgi:phosphatidylinositol kinase/protein kinase (PI-3  family)